MGQPKAPLSPDLPTIAPSHVIQGPERQVLSMVLAPDGSTAWYATSTPVASLSSLLHIASLWIFFGYIFLSLTILLIVRLRIRRRPRTIGRLYCRRCNYDLTDSPAAQACSECGVHLSKRRPVRGRSRPARMIPVVLTGIVLSLPLFWIRTPELLSPKVCGVLDTYWIPVPDSLTSRWPQLQTRRLVQRGEQIRKLNLSTGRDRTLFSLSRTFADLTISPSGRKLMMQSKDGMGLALYDAPTGRTLASYQTNLSRPPGMGFTKPLAIAFTPDERGVYFQWTGGIRLEKFGISLWDSRNSSVTTIFSKESWLAQRNVGAPGTFTPTSMGQSPAFLYTPSFMQQLQEKQLANSLINSGTEMPLAPLKSVSPDCSPAVSMSEGLAFFVDETTSKVIALDLATGEPAGSLPGPVLGLWSLLAFCEERQWLAVPAVSGSIFIRDIRRKEWIAQLTLPKGSYTPNPRFSADGSKLCAVVQRNLDSGTRAPGNPVSPASMTHDGVVWDLSSIIAAQEKAK